MLTIKGKNHIILVSYSLHVKDQKLLILEKTTMYILVINFTRGS